MLDVCKNLSRVRFLKLSAIRPIHFRNAFENLGARTRRARSRMNVHNPDFSMKNTITKPSNKSCVFYSCLQISFILFCSTVLGLQEECIACGEIEWDLVFEGNFGKRGAGKHTITRDFMKEEEKVKKLWELPN